MGRLPEKESLVDIFRWRVKESSESIVSKYNDRSLTYQEYDSNANRVAQGIINEGCKPNGRVAFLAKNSKLLSRSRSPVKRPCRHRLN